MDTKMEWCDKSARGRDTHTYRLLSGNSIEERLLKKSIKHDSRTGCSGRGLFNRLFIPGKVSKNQICARADVQKSLKCFSTAPPDVPQVLPRVRVAPPEHRCATAASRPVTWQHRVPAGPDSQGWVPSQPSARG